MSGLRKVLIFDNNEQERNFLRFLLETEDHAVIDTDKPIEALRMLQEEDIGMMLIGSEVEGMSRQDFRDLIHKLRPGISSIFIPPFHEGATELSINIEELVGLLKNYLRNMGVMENEIAEMKRFSHAIVDRLLQVFQVNDKYFFNNNHLVAELSGKIAVKMGLDENLIEAIQMAALLRDLGKLLIERQLLEEKGRLSPVELTPMKAHPSYTVQILRQVRFPWNLDSIIGQHHEAYDGSGYPVGLKGREISVGARIISIADTYCAMTTDRPYRKAISGEEALKDILHNAGRQFDPEIVEVFLSIAGRELPDVREKKVILTLEREGNITTAMKLNMPAQEADIVHAASSIEAVEIVKHKTAHVIVIDLEDLRPEAFWEFHQIVRVTFRSEAIMLVLIPNRNDMQDFPPDVNLIVKPVSMDELVTKVRTILDGLYSAPAPTSAAGLRGNLKEFELADLIQILNMGFKTAKVEIIRGTGKGMLYLERGKIVHASLGNIKGPEAFFELMGWKEGDFSIVHGQVTKDLNVMADTMYLILEAVRIMDERNAGSKLSEGGSHISCDSAS